MVELVQAYTKEAGVRNLEREIANIMRKVARQVAEGRKRKTVVDVKKLEEYLGPPRFEYGELEAEDQTGSATGLVVTEVGGDVVAVEVTKMEGKEDFILTGQLGEVMRESARAGLSWIRAHAAELGIEREVFEKNTLHIHVPAGGIPKDGPSAGITMATAMVQRAHRDPGPQGRGDDRRDHAPRPGAADRRPQVEDPRRAPRGRRMVILPKKNEKDLRDIPEEIRKQIKLVTAETMDQVLECGAPASPEAAPRPADAGRRGRRRPAQGRAGLPGPRRRSRRPSSLRSWFKAPRRSPLGRPIRALPTPLARARPRRSPGPAGARSDVAATRSLARPYRRHSGAQSWNTAITTRSSASRGPRPRPTSRRPSGSSPASTIPTATRATSPPRSGSRT